MKTFDDLTTELFGPRGTPKREDLERRMRMLGRRRQFLDFCFGWLRRIPLVGIVAYVWWYCLTDEGLDGAIDAMCFSFLNDVNPTARWHSWYRK